MQIKQYLNWENINIDWEYIDMLWEELVLIEEVRNIIRGGSSGYDDYVKGNPWNKLQQNIGEEKTKKFIKILCKINNVDYNNVLEPKNNIVINTSHFEKVFNKIRIEINNI